MSGHGHVAPNADGSKARCGGPGLCAECSREAAVACAAPEPIMQFFGYTHLPPAMQEVSRPFCELAKALTDPSSPAFVPRNAERSVALRKLLEAKDAAVRAGIAK